MALSQVGGIYFKANSEQLQHIGGTAADIVKDANRCTYSRMLPLGLPSK